AHGHARIRRVIVSAWVSSLNFDCESPFKRVNSKERGNAWAVRFEPKTISGSKQCFKRVVESLTAKKLRKPRASTTPSSTLSNNSSSERYDHPEVTNCNVSVDLPLPDGPMISTPFPLSGSTTPALCISNNP